MAEYRGCTNSIGGGRADGAISTFEFLKTFLSSFMQTVPEKKVLTNVTIGVVCTVEENVNISNKMEFLLFKIKIYKN